MTKWMLDYFPSDFWNELLASLKRTDTDYIVFDKDNPFNEFKYDPQDCVFWYGPVSKIGTRSHALPYWPGVICTQDNYKYEWLIQNYRDFCLNNDAIFVPPAQARAIIEQCGNPTWVKPNSGMKTFESFIAYDEYEIRRLDKLSEMVVLASPKQILSEHRVFLYADEYITHSTYKNPGDQNIDESDIIPFVNQLRGMPKPDLICTLDLARTSEGLFINEFNAICSSGWYRGQDNVALVNAINDASQEIWSWNMGEEE